MEELRDIFRDALLKFEQGEKKYGPFVPETDRRDLFAEAEDELLDALNYIGMHVVKLRSMRCENCCNCSKT